MDLAAKLPGLLRIEESKVFPKEDGSPTPAYRCLDLYFADYATCCAAIAVSRSRALDHFGRRRAGARVICGSRLGRARPCPVLATWARKGWRAPNRRSRAVRQRSESHRYSAESALSRGSAPPPPALGHGFVSIYRGSG